jgi:DNA-directed RNA polymerase sigma subunit (sigma70/sigma32)
MGMSRERARQIEDRAMSQIRRDFYPQDLLGDETDSDLDL